MSLVQQQSLGILRSKVPSSASFKNGSAKLVCLSLCRPGNHTRVSKRRSNFTVYNLFRPFDGQVGSSTFLQSITKFVNDGFKERGSTKVRKRERDT